MTHDVTTAPGTSALAPAGHRAGGLGARRRAAGAPRLRRSVLPLLLVPALLAATAGAALAAPPGSVVARGGVAPPPRPTLRVAAAGPVGPPGSWTQVWGDEFDGTALDQTRWAPHRWAQDWGGDNPYNPDIEDAWYGDEGSVVTGGHLVQTITATPRTINGKTYPYRSGVVQSGQHFLLTPGSYVEASIAVPACDGCWPAFWESSTTRWPPEIDNFEFFGTGAGDDHLPQFNYHRADGSQTGPTPYGTGDVRGSFHTYGMRWDRDGTLVPYLDGVAYPASGALRATETDPEEIILNLAVQAGHHPAPGSSMQVDWLRVWQPVVGAPAPPPPPPGPGITVGGGSSATSAVPASRVTLPRPAGTAAGDLLLASMTVDSAPTAAPPSGWQPLAGPLRVGAGATVLTYYHRVTAADASTTSWSWPLSTPVKWGGGITRYVGVDPVTPLAGPVVSRVDTSWAVSSLSTPGLTTTAPGAVVVTGVGTDSAGPDAAPSGSWTPTWLSTGGQMASQASLAKGPSGSVARATWSVGLPRAIAVWAAALRPAAP